MYLVLLRRLEIRGVEYGCGTGSALHSEGEWCRILVVATGLNAYLEGEGKYRPLELHRHLADGTGIVDHVAVGRAVDVSRGGLPLVRVGGRPSAVVPEGCLGNGTISRLGRRDKIRGGTKQRVRLGRRRRHPVRVCDIESVGAGRVRDCDVAAAGGHCILDDAAVHVDPGAKGGIVAAL